MTRSYKGIPNILRKALVLKASSPPSEISINATIGTDRIGYESVLGPHSSGVRNDKGERLLDLCSLHNIKISGSWFRRRNIHRWTWYSNNGRTKKVLDYVLVSARWKLVQDCRVYRSADIDNNADYRRRIMQPPPQTCHSTTANLCPSQHRETA